MKGDSKIIDHLNQALKAELTAVNQYFLHSRLLDDWGFKRLAEKAHEESIEEMKHADALIQRIIFLEGLPNLQELGRLHVGEAPVECLKGDLELEMEAIPMYKEAVAYAESIKDFVSRDLFQDILEDEEEHVDWLETQFDLIDRIGAERYLQSQMS